MAWTPTSGGSVELTDSSGVTLGWLGATSTSTVNLYEWDSALGNQLRMFGIREGEVDGSYLSIPHMWNPKISDLPTSVDGTVYGDDPTSPFSDYEERINYLDSVDVSGVPRLRIIDTAGNSPAYEPDRSLRATVVPAAKWNVNWHFTKIYYGTDVSSAYPDIAVTMLGGRQDRWGIPLNAALDVQYKDPCIVHLPDGKGWLMLLTRVRREARTTDGWTSSDLQPDGCMSDIVAYWADESDPGFLNSDSTTGKNVTGPYWLVINIGTLGPLAPGVRFWASVPCGAMISSDTLAVLFVVEATDYEYAVDGEAASTYESINYLYRSATITSEFVCCLGAHLFSIADLDAQRAAGLYGNEAEWAIRGEYALPRLAGQAYLWLKDSTTGALTDFVNYGSYPETLRLADPQFSRCSLGDPNTPIGTLKDLHLFNAVINRLDGGSTLWKSVSPVLHGLWTSTPFDTGEETGLPRRDGSTSDSVAGFDYLLSSETPFEAAIPSTTPSSVDDGNDVSYSLPLDPDPVRVVDTTGVTSGEGRVAFGREDDHDPSSYALSTLGEVSTDDPCTDASALRSTRTRQHLLFESHVHPLGEASAHLPLVRRH